MPYLWYLMYAYTYYNQYVCNFSYVIDEAKKKKTVILFNEFLCITIFFLHMRLRYIEVSLYDTAI